MILYLDGMSNSSVNQREIEHFAADAARWWDVDGPFKPLHRLNPVRMQYIKERICAHYGLDYKSLNALSDLSVIDVGCGGGLVCEPMARMGADVTGIDADAVAISVATSHAEENGLDIDYLNKAAEDVQEQFDVVLALEIIEHVNDPQDFVAMCSRFLKPGGIIIFSTLNQTPKSFAFGIVAAEYLLQWVPRGTHNWKKFVKPATLARMMRAGGLAPEDTCGLVFNPIKNEFLLSAHDLDVNYFICGSKAL